jgi:CarD family transcriptional regulator
VNFAVGDRVVYPQHGATVIAGVETLQALGSVREYFVLHFAEGGLTLRVPSEAADAIGMREVISGDEAKEVFSVLRRRNIHVPSNWSRRFKNHATMLKSGDVYQVAEVVRNLSRRNKVARLSAGEMHVLMRARQVLASELCLALGEDPERVDGLLDDALR